MTHRPATREDMVRTAGVLFVSIAISAVISLSAASGGRVVGGVPVMVVCALVALGIQWIAWIPASLARTERFYDLTGSLSYLTVLAVSLLGMDMREWMIRRIAVFFMVCIWAVRLGAFLFSRILNDGRDRRFDRLKDHPVRFLVPWTLQGLWVFLTSLSVLIINTRATPGEALGALDFLGMGLWTLGWAIEVVADAQKRRFRARIGELNTWIDEGLWSYSRHPNYFGEILLWSGLACMGASVFSGAQWLGLLSPIFVGCLLSFISGIPLLDARAMKKWGDNPAYVAYRKRTRSLLPLPRKGSEA